MIQQNYQTVGPAYGRDYTSAKAAKADFVSGLDFCMLSMGHNATYCSVRDFRPGLTVMVRYSHMRKVTPVVVTEGMK